MKTFTKLAFATALLLSAGSLSAQRNCGQEEMVEHQFQQNPQLQKVRDDINAHALAYTDAVAANPNAKVNAVVTIPVVVHVVYNTATENISDAQIQSQINVLNADFRRTNSDAGLVPSAFSSLAADAEIQFCMARRTPTGAATTGIVRVSSTVTAFGLSDNMKFSSTGGSNAWNPSKYLNIWVCDIGGGTLGFAYLPGTAPSGADGVVIDYRYFGTTSNVAAPFNKGRTATHEVGHYLNLDHIWGGNSASCTDSDNVSDTPNQADENYGCPAFPQVSCSNGPNGDMFMNYMDYVDDACMFMFSTGQKNRMQALFASGGFRVGLVTSDGCLPPSGTCGATTASAATSVGTTSATANWSAVTGAVSYTLEYKTNAATTWTSITGITTTSRSLTGLTAGTTYNYRVTTVCSGSSATVSNTVNFTTTAAATCPSTTANAATSITSTSATANWSAVSGATSYTLQYKTNAATTWTSITGITTTSRSLTGLTAGTTYNYRVTTVCASGSATVSNTVNFTTTAAGCTDNYETNETSATAKTITLNADNTAKICTATDIDWYTFTTTTTTTGTNVRINLSTLPADYDVELYNSAGTTRLSFSDNAGTTSEQIIYNTTTATTYRVKVFGYGGVFNTSQNYTLRCSTKTTSFVRLSDDGSAESIDAAGISKVTVFPNPANDKVNVQFMAAREGKANIQLLDLTGKVVHVRTAEAGEGENTMGLNIQDIASGMYLVRIELNGEMITRRLDIVR